VRPIPRARLDRFVEMVDDLERVNDVAVMMPLLA
jgi:hypothetical protein